MATWSRVLNMGLVFALLTLTACGGGGGGDDGPVGVGNVTISGVISDTVVPPRLASRALAAVTDWSAAVVEVLDASGTVIATAAGNLDGTFQVSVPPGTNYCLRVTQGNLVLLAFLPSVQADLTNADVNPESAALAAVLGAHLGQAVGEPGVDLTGALGGVDVAAVLAQGAADPGFGDLVSALEQDIDTNYDEAGTEPSVGSAGTAGDAQAAEIAAAVDLTAPANITAADFIAGGAESTETATVTLALAATDAMGVTAYFASEAEATPAATAAGWTAVDPTASYAATVEFTLSTGDGTKTVQVWFKDAVGNVSSVASDGIEKITPTYTVGGSVSGLTGTVVLQNNGGDNLTITGSGFTFATELISGAPYDVTVLTQPAGQTCAVANGSGVVPAGNVTTVAVTCTDVTVPTYTVGGTVSGLTGTVVLQNNGGDNLTVTGSGFTFATALVNGAAYDVTVLTQPAGQSCTVANGSGLVPEAAVTSVAVTCTTTVTYPIGGHVAGLTSGTLVLRNNGGDDLSLTADGLFTFGTELTDGVAYDITVNTQPAGLFCAVDLGSGIVAGAPVEVFVQCTTPASYPVGGIVSGLTGTVVLQNNGGDDLSVSANGVFAFATAVLSGSAYNVTVLTHPAGQSCAVTGGSGTMPANAVTSIDVVCGASVPPPNPPVAVLDPRAVDSFINFQPVWAWTPGGGGDGTYRYAFTTSASCQPWLVDLEANGTLTQETQLVVSPDLEDGYHAMCLQERNAIGEWSVMSRIAYSIDTVPPTVTGTYPSADATGVEVIPAISVDFSEYVPWNVDERSNLITVQDSTGSLVPGDCVPASGGIDRYFFEARTALQANETYTVTATALLADRHGNALDPHVWQFTTRPPPTLYPDSPDWNDYVKNDGPTVFDASGTPCDGTETGGYQSCIHVGEMRAFDVPGRTSCAGLTAADQLGALDWVCRDNGGAGPVQFVSVGLQANTTLYSLLKTVVPTGFLPNALTVWDGATELFTTTPDAWWGNWVIVNKTASSPATLFLNEPGAVYAFTYHPGDNDLTVLADRVAMALNPGATFGSRANNGGAFYASNRAFLWIEGNFNAEGDTDGWEFVNVTHSVLRQLRVEGAELGNLTFGTGGIYLNGSHNNRIEDVAVAFNGLGLNLLGSNDNTISDVQAISNTRAGIKLASSSGNVILNVNANNNFTGIHLAGGAVDNLVAAATLSHNVQDGLLVAGSTNRVGLVTAMNNGRDGVRVENTSYNLFFNVAANDNLQHGFSLTGATGTTVENLVAANNGPPQRSVTQSSGVYLEDSDAYFTGHLKVGSNGLGTVDDCVLAGTTSGVADDCTATGGSDHALTSGVVTGPSIIGIIGTDDIVNASDGGALNTLYPASVDLFAFDWWEFETPLRNWGASGYATTSAESFLLQDRSRFGCASHILEITETRCTGYWGDPWHDQGAIWDFRMPASDTVLRGAALPHLSGNAADTVLHPLVVGSEVFLRNAVEFVDPSPFAAAAGDGDGLCESGELCLYAPNIGSYLGDGDPIPAGSFSDGDTLNSIELWEIPNNGE